MKISVVLAAYRGEKFLDAQLRSLLHQTRLPDEILIGDDSRDDLTEKVVRNFQKNTSSSCRIIYYRNPEQLGVYRNFEELFKRASGDFIFVCDQDDLWQKRKIALMMEEMEQHPETGLLVCGSIQFRQEPSGKRSYSLPYRPDSDQIRKINQGEPFVLLRKFYPSLGHDFLLRKSFLAAALPIEELECYDLWLYSAACMTKSIRLLEDRLTWQRVHENNCSGPDFSGSGIAESRIKAMKREYFGTDEISSSAKRFRDLLYFSKKHTTLKIHPEMERKLSGISQFYEFRTWVRRKPFFLRIFFCTFHLPGYIRWANHFRSFVRDLFF